MGIAKALALPTSLVAIHEPAAWGFITRLKALLAVLPHAFGIESLLLCVIPGGVQVSPVATPIV
jgi:hypothetical protein